MQIIETKYSLMCYLLYFDVTLLIIINCFDHIIIYVWYWFLSDIRCFLVWNMFFQAADVYRNVFADSLRQPILYQVMLRCLTDSYTSDKPPVGMMHSLNLQMWWLYPSTSHPFCWLICKIYMLPLNFYDWSPVMYQRMYQMCFKVFIPDQDSWPASVK